MAEREAIQASYDQARNKNEEASKAENEARDAELQAWNEAKKLKKEEERKFKASAAFKTLDVNQDGKITTDEMQLRKEFDVDEDGVVSVEEANIFLGNETEVEVDHFISHIWDSIEHTYKSEVEEDSHDEEKPAAPAEESIAEIDSKLDYRDAEADDLDAKELLQDYENEESLEENIGKEEKEFNTDIFKKRYINKRIRKFDSLPQEELPDDENISYSNETQRLIDLAQAARSEFYEIERKILKICLTKILAQKMPSYLSTNSALKSKMLNIRTSCKLGSLVGKDWRKVIIQCGIENSLLSSSEPSICEYVLTFQSPAACDTLPEHLNQEHEL
ncbi:Glucosidase 2 subunit beta [Trichinella pseudospiralis]|uniref:Glucosidase 2 subunit beta n=1 Tax=Trichinella pseudospiralis TaxID=6337 RepID=A0A0V0YG71_TRIPS|nr:Glucosidase 2 subunit beta [Trichinella pseudospiralis]